MRDMCEYIQNLAHPSVQEIMDRLGTNNICTTTQCFTSPEDAGFGMILQYRPEFNANQILYAFIMFASFAYLIMFRNHPSTNTSTKSSIVNVIRDEDPIS